MNVMERWENQILREATSMKEYEIEVEVIGRATIYVTADSVREAETEAYNCNIEWHDLDELQVHRVRSISE